MNRPFFISLSISLLAHGVLIARMPYLVSVRPQPRRSELRQVTLPPETIKKISRSKNTAFQKPPAWKDPAPGSLIADRASVSEGHTQLMEAKAKEIALRNSSADKTLEKNPAYVDYYRIIREKIRSNAFRYYIERVQGEIFLSFTIAANGVVEDVYITNESALNPQLRSIAMRSINEAAPFPLFPKELKNYPRLQFNISIYFKNN